MQYVYPYTHDIDILAFNDDIVKYELITNPKDDLSQLCEQYHTTFKTLIDKHAPIRSKSIKSKPSPPWMSPEIISAKVRRRYLERIWRKSRIQLNRSRYTKKSHFCNRLMNKAKSDFYRNLNSENSLQL